ncbi:bifunctional RNase H/acid phosphatase [Nocardioides sp. KR10-350]|uniref:bifunctional RNase H/acid phosphatase n=1 Tax=Nocardioides cheoyonin TaxID=3156615 RepID=UPI0032B3F7DA
MARTSVIIEADGGSRGNPGPAAYGAVLKDAETGEVIAEEGTTIGRASNNVAEYQGLIAGLRMAAEYAPEADIEVRMDSKLVVEQMSGRWKIKHPDMRPLALEANRLAPFGTVYTWIPRERNKHADRLVNEALDGLRSGVTVGGGGDESLVAELESPEAAEAADEAAEQDGAVEAQQPPARGWSMPGATATTLVVVRHGVTPHTAAKRFSGGLGGDNPGLSDDGRSQIRATADWISPIADRVGAVVASPVRRTRESADIIAETLGVPVEEEPGFAETEFGEWDGLTLAEIDERFPGELKQWFSSMDYAPPGGESFTTVQKRVLDGLDRLLTRHAGETVVVVSHVTPIKLLVARVVGAGLDAGFRMELSPASVTVLAFYDDDRASMRLYNAQPPGADAFSGPAW